MGKRKKVSKKSSSDSTSKQLSIPLKEITYEKQIDIPQPKLGLNKKSEYVLFNTPLNGKASITGTKNTYFPELEKLARKINKVFSKKGRKYLLKKQNESNDNKIQISIASMNGEVFLTYTKLNINKTTN